MANRWGENNSDRLYFLDSKITADSDCSHEIKRCLLLGRKAMTNLDSILKSRDITLQRKVCLVKAMVFPVVTCGCESWTIKKPECRRINAFALGPIFILLPDFLLVSMYLPFQSFIFNFSFCPRFPLLYKTF